MKITLLLIILFGGQLIAQNDTLNKFNSNGKKHGYWIQYLDKNLNPTDSNKSNYKGYSLYENGKLLLGFDKQRLKKKLLLVTDSATLRQGEFVTGSFKWIRPKTKQIRIEENCSKGHLISRKEIEYSGFFDLGPRDVVYSWDFTKLFENTLGSFYLECDYSSESNPGTDVKKYWMLKDGKKWKLTRIK